MRPQMEEVLMMAPAPLLPHHRQNILGGQKDAGGIDLHHLHPLVLHHFLDGLADVDAGVVHHHIQPSALGDDALYDGLPLLLAGDIRHGAVGLAALTLQLLHQLVDLLLHQIQDPDLGPILGSSFACAEPMPPAPPVITMTLFCTFVLNPSLSCVTLWLPYPSTPWRGSARPSCRR